MNNETQNEASEEPGILSGWTLPAVLFTAVAFWCAVGASTALFFRDWHALTWALVAFALSVFVVYEKRGE